MNALDYFRWNYKFYRRHFPVWRSVRLAWREARKPLPF